MKKKNTIITKLVYPAKESKETEPLLPRVSGGRIWPSLGWCKGQELTLLITIIILKKKFEKTIVQNKISTIYRNSVKALWYFSIV